MTLLPVEAEPRPFTTVTCIYIYIVHVHVSTCVACIATIYSSRMILLPVGADPCTAVIHMYIYLVTPAMAVMYYKYGFISHDSPLLVRNVPCDSIYMCGSTLFHSPPDVR